MQTAARGVLVATLFINILQKGERMIEQEKGFNLYMARELVRAGDDKETDVIAHALLAIAETLVSINQTLTYLTEVLERD